MIRNRLPSTLFPILLWCRLMAVAALLALGAPAPAQPDVPGTAPAPAATAPDPARATPSATMMTFLRAFPDETEGRPDRIVPDAISTMQFTGALALLDEAQRREQAINLKYVLDRSRYITEGDLREYDRVAAAQSRGVVGVAALRSGSISLVRAENGEWLFSAETVAALRDMVDEVAGRPVVAGVTATVEQARTVGQDIRRAMPLSLREKVVLLEGWQILGLLALVIIGMTADRIFVFLLTGITRLWLRRQGVDVEQVQVSPALRPLGWLASAAVWTLLMSWLLLPPKAEAVLSFILRFMATWCFVAAAYRGVDVMADYLTRKAKGSPTKMDALLLPFVSRAVKVFVIAFGVVFVAQNIGVDVTSLLAGLGIGAFAIGLAAKESIENFFGSLTILMDRPFKVGDWVIIDGGTEGTVEHVGFRSTRVRTFANSLITLPNATLIRAKVDNMGERQFRRWKTTLSLTYDTPPEKIEAFCEAIRHLIRLHPYTRKDFYNVNMRDFGAASLDIDLTVFWRVPDFSTEMRERHRLALDIIRVAKEVGVEFAFPTQTIWLPKELPAHADKPADPRAAHVKAREIAGRVVRSFYGEKVVGQPPVSFSADPAELDPPAPAGKAS